MAKSKSKKSKQDSITITRDGFIALVLFLIAFTIFAVYFYKAYAG